MDNSDNSPSSGKRLFIGIKIPVTKMLDQLTRSVMSELSDAKIKWVIPGNFHITLKFLGLTPGFYINSINQIIKTAVRKVAPFELTLRSISTFGKPKPKIVWVGTEVNECLQILYHELNINLTELGFENDYKEYNPHLTIGRIKHLPDHVNLNNILSFYKNRLIQKTLIDEVILFESKSVRNGPVYSILCSYKLK